VEIHKPKPWHGLREFFKEYLIIVVGVLTALGAEALVENLHWRHEAEVAREVIRRDELRLLEWIGEADASGACVDRRLTELKTILDKAQETGELPPLGFSAKPPTQPWFMRGWDSALSSGVLPHLRPGEGARYAAIESGVQTLIRSREDNVAQWALLSAFNGPGRKLSEAEAATLRSAISKARIDAVVIRTSADALGLMVLDTGLLARKAVDAAYQTGAVKGAQEPTCRPMSAAAGPEGIPALAAPPKAPEGSYDQAISAYRDTIVR
jgi:hypothetical protein